LAEGAHGADGIEVHALDRFDADTIAGLSRVLIDCVEGGASVSFMQPLAPARAADFWHAVAASVARGERCVLIARTGRGEIVGTVQLLLNLPENQPHRADLAKMLVHRSARRHGVGAALLAGAERAARARGRTLLVLDTASADAGRLYARHGWQRVGEIPGYALYPDGRPCATTFFFKALEA
jgi:GNAT superfamily N-acetyltransferase